MLDASAFLLLTKDSLAAFQRDLDDLSPLARAFRDSSGDAADSCLQPSWPKRFSAQELGVVTRNKAERDSRLKALNDETAAAD